MCVTSEKWADYHILMKIKWKELSGSPPLHGQVSNWPGKVVEALGFGQVVGPVGKARTAAKLCIPGGEVKLKVNKVRYVEHPRGLGAFIFQEHTCLS